jgi:hypothetical protein
MNMPESTRMNGFALSLVTSAGMPSLWSLGESPRSPPVICVRARPAVLREEGSS